MKDFATQLERELVALIEKNITGAYPLMLTAPMLVETIRAAREYSEQKPYPMVTTFEGHSEQEIRVAFAALKWAKNCAMPVLKYYDAQNAGTWKRTMAQQVIDDAPQEIK